MNNKFKLFTIGPVQLFERTLKLKSEPLNYFRNEEFSEKYAMTSQRLKELSGSCDETDVLYLTCSGTGAMDAVADNVLDQDSKALVLSSGSFGDRFFDICSRFTNQIECLQLDPMNVLETLEAKKNIYSHIFVTMHETSTGYLAPMQQISKYAEENNSYLIVDGITSFMCDDLSINDLKIDVLIASSHKGLCVSPGLSVVFISRNMRSFIEKNQDIRSYYFNFKTYFRDSKRCQTPFTPALGVFDELSDITEWMIEVGQQNWVNEVNNKAKHFRRLIGESFILPDYDQSNAITLIQLSGGFAEQLLRAMKEKGFVCNPCSGAMQNSHIRVSHVGNITETDLENLATELLAWR